MKIPMNETVTPSRPRNKSVEAYKAWIMEIARRLTTKETSIQMTETEWIASWKEYWTEHFRSTAVH